MIGWSENAVRLTQDPRRSSTHNNRTRGAHCLILGKKSSEVGENEINGGMVGGDDECDTGKSRLVHLSLDNQCNISIICTDKRTDKQKKILKKEYKIEECSFFVFA